MFPEAYVVRLQTRDMHGAELFACASGSGCPAHRVNDMRKDPLRNPRGEPGEAPNCQFAEVLSADGRPTLYILASKDIPADAECLLDYGERYWRHHKLMLDQFLAAAGAFQGGLAGLSRL